MTLLTHYNPFQELNRISREMENLFSNEKSEPRFQVWAPLADITEEEKGYTIKLELPEVRKEDVKITVTDGVLSIQGERRFEREEKGKKYHRIERSYGSFVRQFNLPDNVDADTVNASYKDGVLTVRVDKREEAKPKTIEIQVG